MAAYRGRRPPAGTSISYRRIQPPPRTPSGSTGVVDLRDIISLPSCLQDFASYGDTGQVRSLGAVHLDGVGTFVNPDVVDPTSSLAPGATWGAAEEGGPDAYGIDAIENLDDDVSGNIDYEIFNPASWS